jgi:uncharacterized protein
VHHPAVAQSIDLLGFLMLGLLGGFGHCVGMCSPFVLFVSRRYHEGRAGLPPSPTVGSGPASQAAWLPRRATLVAQAWYTAGRVLTYTALGALAGALGGVVQEAGALVGIQRAALLLAGAVLVVWALAALSNLVVGQASRLHPATARRAEAPGAEASRLPDIPVRPTSRWPAGGTLFTRLAGIVKRRVPGHPLAIGLFLGLLPCGFLYSAVVAAVGRGGALDGAAALALFGIGTAPALIVVSLADELVARRRPLLNRLSQSFILAMGCWFLWRALAR